MSQTTASTEPHLEAIAANPGNILMDLIVALLAPMFLCVTDGDIGMARLAAIETVNAYRAHNHAGLLAVAQIIACGLAALGSLSLSMADDISLSMTLRLRGNAVALNRSAEHSRRALRDSLTNDDPMPHHVATAFAMAAEPELPAAISEDADRACAEPFLNAAAAQALAAESEARLYSPEQTLNRVRGPAPAHIGAATPTSTPEAKRHEAMWAISMVKESQELTASLSHIPPAERRTASLRAASLSSTANELLTGVSSSTPNLRGPPTQPDTI